jgi:hypothetical protein
MAAFAEGSMAAFAEETDDLEVRNSRSCGAGVPPANSMRRHGNRNVFWRAYPGAPGHHGMRLQSIVGGQRRGLNVDG